MGVLEYAGMPPAGWALPLVRGSPAKGVAWNVRTVVKNLYYWNSLSALSQNRLFCKF
jgi:hypothetical protein